jgi:hypothetical protein
MLLEGNPIRYPGATVIRRDAFVEAELFDESIRIVKDYPLRLRLARGHPLVQIGSRVVAIAPIPAVCREIRKKYSKDAFTGAPA